MRLINADLLKPDKLSKSGQVCISQSQIANTPTIEIEDVLKYLDLEGYVLVKKELWENVKKALDSISSRG